MYPPYQDNSKHPYPMNIHATAHPPCISSAAGSRWSTGLCHCCDDPANCFVTCMCPCVTFGQIAEMVNKGSISCAASGAVYGVLLGFTGLSCLYSCFYRSRLRGQYDLEEGPCVDCLVHFFCEPCAPFVKNIESSRIVVLIWELANMDRQSRGITVAPAVTGGMFR